MSRGKNTNIPHCLKLGLRWFAARSQPTAEVCLKDLGLGQSSVGVNAFYALCWNYLEVGGMLFGVRGLLLLLLLLMSELTTIVVGLVVVVVDCFVLQRFQLSSSSSSSIGVQEILPIPPTVIRPGLGACNRCDRCL